MKTVIITQSSDLQHEENTIRTLLGERVIVHIRKKEKTPEEMRIYLDKFTDLDLQYLTLHGHHDLAREYSVGGIHLSSTEALADLKNWNGRVSRSCHSFEELNHLAERYDYVFLSPIYDSISKQGYSAAFSLKDIMENLRDLENTRVYALGGVTSDKLDDLKNVGFKGAAICGDFWNSGSSSLRQYLSETIIEND